MLTRNETPRKNQNSYHSRSRTLILYSSLGLSSSKILGSHKWLRSWLSALNVLGSSLFDAEAMAPQFTRGSRPSLRFSNDRKPSDELRTNSSFTSAMGSSTWSEREGGVQNF